MSTSLATSGQVKSLGVPAGDMRDLTVSVTDASGLACRHASLTALPDGQLGTSNVIFMPPPSAGAAGIMFHAVAPCVHLLCYFYDICVIH